MAADQDTPQQDLCMILVKTVTLGVVIVASLLGNSLVLYVLYKEQGLRKPPFFLLANVSVADLVKTVFCLPFVIIAVVNDSGWDYGRPLCQVVAFFNTMLLFGVIFTHFTVSITRYIVVTHSKFHRKKLTGSVCAVLICVIWTVAIIMAFPPVFGLGTYEFIREEEQCNFRHKHYLTNDTLGFLLILSIVLFATHLIYLRLFVFMRMHRKMNPVVFVPALSHNWTFFGPGATGQAAANWMQGFGRGPAPPVLGGGRQPQQPRNNNNSSSSSMRNNKLPWRTLQTEKKTSRLHYVIIFMFLVLWTPYLVQSYWHMLAKERTIPSAFMTISAWMTYVQVCVNPFLCVLFSREFRKAAQKNL
ncbi:putative G protein-coupled receptor 85 [Branchiostoma floridae x Branchiostoma japonicum]